MKARYHVGMKDCLFCKIISGEIPAYTIYEDESVVAFLDIFPVHEGHTLVVPKMHEPHLHHLPEDIYTHVMQVAQKTAQKIEKVLAPERVGFVIAGWDVPHAHVHVVPMQEPEDLTERMKTPNRAKASPESLDAVQAKLAF